MISLKRILLPTDFSDYAAHAKQYACALADRFDAELHLLHVVQDLIALTPEPGMAFPTPAIDLDELQAAADQSLRTWLDPQWSQGKRLVYATRQGAPFLEIVRYAKDVEVDLIIATTHGRSGLAHVLIGSVAERIVRKAPCPVLTIRPSTHQFVLP